MIARKKPRTDSVIIVQGEGKRSREHRKGRGEKEEGALRAIQLLIWRGD